MEKKMGHVLWWFYGGSTGNVTATDNNGNIYLAGTTSSSDYIATPNTHQTNLYNSGNDAYLIKFKIVNQALVPLHHLHRKYSRTKTGGTNYSWTGPNGSPLHYKTLQSQCNSFK
jgi:hypothetical protein